MLDKSKQTSSSKSSETPSIDFRMQTCRFLTELQLFKESVKVLETVVGDDDERVEAWYLLAFALFRLKKHATAEECCENVRNLIIKFKIVDPDLEAGTREIYEEICKWKAKNNKDKPAAATEKQGEDEEWATDSEEDIDGDEDEDMKD